MWQLYFNFFSSGVGVAKRRYNSSFCIFLDCNFLALLNHSETNPWAYFPVKTCPGERWPNWRVEVLDISLHSCHLSNSMSRTVSLIVIRSRSLTSCWVETKGSRSSQIRMSFWWQIIICDRIVKCVNHRYRVFENGVLQTLVDVDRSAKHLVHMQGPIRS